MRFWLFFVLCKLVLQTRTRNHTFGLDVGLFVYFHTVCEGSGETAGCTGSPEPSLDAHVISTIISWAGSFQENCFKVYVF